jgi:hypothetical protein
VTAEFPHLHPSQQEIAQLNNDARIAWIRQERWIQYPRAKRILERLADLVDYPPHDRMPCLVIYGGTGMGKTRVVQKCPRDNRAHFDGKLGRTCVPVVSIQMPPAPVERDLYEEILVAMSGVFAYGTSVTTLRHRIRALSRQLEVWMGVTAQGGLTPRPPDALLHPRARKSTRSGVEHKNGTLIRLAW